MMGSFIDPVGWMTWVGTSAPDTIFYAEFGNYGQGALTKNRVTWKGLKFITSKEVSKFTVNPFIQGDKWVKDTGVPYKSRNLIYSYSFRKRAHLLYFLQCGCNTQIIFHPKTDLLDPRKTYTPHKELKLITYTI
ncbi:root hair specific 12 [Artemisia annua]|uniref:Root hair specific 12 n=1 Tax=Artemisia annua TaxID=35608 RepID=A0A2U1KBK8_ARTAN|nr:root hair specific 12 [Artemisia annua]